ncbi:hypothetical protein U0070_014580 [Myodes glareolus]|uniref:Uncharacterized protein n=1 Tax=Myodes glareolus TaxID=447135 RepID=A0AAW0H7T2_MYOGA
MTDGWKPDVIKIHYAPARRSNLESPREGRGKGKNPIFAGNREVNAETHSSTDAENKSWVSALP